MTSGGACRARLVLVVEFDVQGLAGREVEEGFGFGIRDPCHPGSGEKEEGCNACGHGAWDTCRGEHDGPPCCRSQGAIEPKKESEPEVMVAGADEGGDFLRLVCVGFAETAFADELVGSEGLDAAGVAMGGLGQCEDDEFSYGGFSAVGCGGLSPVVVGTGGEIDCRCGACRVWLRLREGEGGGEEGSGEDCGDCAGCWAWHRLLLGGKEMKRLWG